MNRSLGRLPLLALVLMFAACDDDDCTTCLDPSPPAPTIENVWPNEDGRAWTYDQIERAWADTTITSTTVFTIDHVDSVLANVAPIGSERSADVWRLAFDGSTTTDSGVTAQLLRGFFYRDVEGTRRWVPSDLEWRPERLALPPRITVDHLLARRVDSVGGLMLRGDAAFEKTDAYIGSYGDLNADLAWKYLEANLEVDHTFTLQLVPDITDDAFLTVRIRSIDPFETPYRSFENAVIANYLIDQGVSTLVDEGGQELGAVRIYAFGRIVYAPEIGPIYCIERTLLSYISGVPSTGLVFEYEYELIGASGPHVAE